MDISGNRGSQLVARSALNDITNIENLLMLAGITYQLMELIG